MSTMINNVIHSATNADFTNNVYTSVYSNADVSVTINGSTISIPKGLMINNINIKSISSTNNVFLVGYKKLNI